MSVRFSNCFLVCCTLSMIVLAGCDKGPPEDTSSFSTGRSGQHQRGTSRHTSATALPPELHEAFRQIQSEQDQQQRARKILSRNVSMDYRKMPLEVFAEKLEEVSGLQVVVNSQALEEDGLMPEDIIIDAVFKNVTFRTALGLILGEHDLICLFRDNILIITTHTDAESCFLLQCYSVNDFVDWERARWYQAEAAKARTVPQPVNIWSSTCDYSGIDSLEELITSFTAWPENGWPEERELEIKRQGSPCSSFLLISKEDCVHNEIAELLSDLRGLRLKQSKLPALQQKLNYQSDKPSKELLEIIEQPVGDFEYDFPENDAKVIHLEKFVGLIREKTGVNCWINKPAMEEGGVDWKAVKLDPQHFHGISLRSIFRIVLQQNDCRWYIHRDVIVITSSASSDDCYYTRVYDISGLLDQPEELRLGDETSLKDIVIKSVLPRFWSEADGRDKMREFHAPGIHALVVHSTLARHKEIAQVLARLYRSKVKFPCQRRPVIQSPEFNRVQQN